jgi:hypothetical protein
VVIEADSRETAGNEDELNPQIIRLCIPLSHWRVSQMEEPILAKRNNSPERPSFRSHLRELNWLRKDGRHEDADYPSAQSRAFEILWPRSHRSETNGELEESMATSADAFVAVRRYWQKGNSSVR